LENELENAIKQQLSGNLSDLLGYDQDLEFHKNGYYSRSEIESRFHKIWFPRVELLNQSNAQKVVIDDFTKINDFTKKIRIQRSKEGIHLKAAVPREEIYSEANNDSSIDPLSGSNSAYVCI
jgi:hypothetical protein